MREDRTLPEYFRLPSRPARAVLTSPAAGRGGPSGGGAQVPNHSAKARAAASRAAQGLPCLIQDEAPDSKLLAREINRGLSYIVRQQLEIAHISARGITGADAIAARKAVDDAIVEVKAALRRCAGRARKRPDSGTPPVPDRSDYDVIGVRPQDGMGVISAKFKRLARTHHPDAGGDTAAFQRLTAAYERIRRRRNAKR